jgi:hypothetical protein
MTGLVGAQEGGRQDAAREALIKLARMRQHSLRG